jgi:hypothetical protein
MRKLKAIAKCKDEDGDEVLTIGNDYAVLRETRGGVIILNDNDNEHFFPNDLKDQYFEPEPNQSEMILMLHAVEIACRYYQGLHEKYCQESANDSVEVKVAMWNRYCEYDNLRVKMLNR